MPVQYFQRLATEPLPRRITQPFEIAVVQALVRARHVEATFDLVDDMTVGTVHGLTPLGRKIMSCLQNGPQAPAH